MDFSGTFDHTLDAKNRLTVPSKFRATLAGTVFVVRGADPCLSVYPEAEYQRLTSESFRGLAPLSAEYRELRRFFNGHADSTDLDGAGRIALKPAHLAHAAISGRDAVVVGAGECLEIWDRAAWNAYDADLTSRATELTASLGHPG